MRARFSFLKQKKIDSAELAVTAFSQFLVGRERARRARERGSTWAILVSYSLATRPPSGFCLAPPPGASPPGVARGAGQVAWRGPKPPGATRALTWPQAAFVWNLLEVL